MTYTQSVGIGVAATIVIVIGVAAFTKPTSPPTSANASQQTGALISDESSTDFGTLSMAKGTASRSFTIRNTGTGPVTITKLYTSCMCTTATLSLGGRDIGPFGMQGHGIVPSFKETIAAGEQGNVTVVFDPAAHGPAGVGNIARTVFIENDAGQPLEFNFTARVIP